MSLASARRHRGVGGANTKVQRVLSAGVQHLRIPQAGCGGGCTGPAGSCALDRWRSAAQAEARHASGNSCQRGDQLVAMGSCGEGECGWARGGHRQNARRLDTDSLGSILAERLDGLIASSGLPIELPRAIQELGLSSGMARTALRSVSYCCY